LAMNFLLAASYKSQSQCARVVTEDWAARNLYCPACMSDKLVQAPNNARAIDFNCGRCSAAYQLKSGRGWSEHRIPDAGYEAMIRAIRSDNVPNLLVMQYSVTWNVRNLLLVPSFFFAETAIERRKPLGPAARRAGWVGCNILLSAISPEGKIRLVTDEAIEDRRSVRDLYKKIKPIAELKGGLRGWALNVLRMVHKVGKPQFNLEDVYAFEAELSRLYPDNRNVRPKIRQQLQVLRDIGLISFLGRGNYALRS
jgi:type II restriction enzyme